MCIRWAGGDELVGFGCLGRGWSAARQGKARVAGYGEVTVTGLTCAITKCSVLLMVATVGRGGGVRIREGCLCCMW